jgi:hypothetical protein
MSPPFPFPQWGKPARQLAGARKGSRNFKNRYLFVDKYSLNIAGYTIRFEKDQNGPELVPSERFTRNITSTDKCNILIRVHRGEYPDASDSEMVFNAPYVEEIDGVPVKKLDKFWSIHRKGDDLFIRSIFPQYEISKRALLKFSLESPEWDLWIDGTQSYTDPMEYPLDGLILYYLTVINGDIMIHASGVNHVGKGYLFSGISGRGKSTMARLWDLSGAKVIHDDRLIIRGRKGAPMIYNTPVYNNDLPSESPLDKIFLIDHGTSNHIIHVDGAAAVSLVMANCIQHNWDSKIVSKLLAAVSDMCTAIPVSRLLFRPDKSVVDYILANEQP